MSFRRSVLALTALGACGVLFLIPITAWSIAALPAPPLPPPVLAVLAAIQPFMLVFAGAVAGAFAAPRLGLRSLAAERAGGRPVAAEDLRALFPYVVLSIGVGVAINLADELARPLWLPDGVPFPLYDRSWSPVTLGFGMLYGGLTEEVTFRWGLMSLTAWLLWTASGRARPIPAPLIAAAILISSIVFAAGHLPSLAALLPLSAGPVLRTLLLNSVAGLWLGWIFWRKHLEAAMLSHAAIHVGFAIYALTMLALR